MLERLYNEICEREPDRHRARPMLLSILATYYMLNPFLYLFSISQDKVFLNFGVGDWRFALLYCVGAPLLGYLLWTLRVRAIYALYAFVGFEVIRGWRHGYWDVVFLGVAVFLYSMRSEIRDLFRPHAREAHH